MESLRTLIYLPWIHSILHKEKRNKTTLSTGLRILAILLVCAPKEHEGDREAAVSPVGPGYEGASGQVRALGFAGSLYFVMTPECKSATASHAQRNSVCHNTTGNTCGVGPILTKAFSKGDSWKHQFEAPLKGDLCWNQTKSIQK